MGKKPLLVIFLTVFIDLVGFGIIIPLSPYLAREFGASAFQVGLLMAIYSGLQFIFSPIWGGLSDRVGRRPILLISLIGTAVAHGLFYISTSLTGLFLARALAGLFSANISTAMAYMADVSSTKDRSKSMGLIGAAFGLGFVLGPALGGVFSRWGESLPALIAALICLGNFIFASFVLKESLPAELRKVRVRKSRLQNIFDKLRRPVSGTLLFAFFASSLAMANMEAALFLYMHDRFGWTMEKASFGFAYVGLCMAFTQGFLIRKLLPRYGERWLLLVGYSFFSVAMVMIGLSHSIPLMAVAMTLLALGTGFINPSINGSLSVLSGADEQGEVLGVSQSLAALARILGPPVGGLIYQRVDQASPFLLAGFLGAVGLFFIGLIRQKIPQSSLVRTPSV